MKIKMIHGYFIFEETRVGQAFDFMKLSGLSLIRKDDYYTFEKLLNAPDYSITGKDLLGFKATKTFAGKPWEVFKANGIVYDFTSDSIKLLSAIDVKAPIAAVGNRFYSNGLILPGSNTDVGRVTDYLAWYLRDRAANSWLYSEVTYA